MKTEMYLFQFLRAGKSKIKVAAGSMSGDGLFLIHALCPYIAEEVGVLGGLPL